MQRFVLIMLVLFAVLCAEGCGRRARTKRDKVGVVKEEDFLFARNVDEVLKYAGPKRVITLDENSIKTDDEGNRIFKDEWFEFTTEIKWPEMPGNAEKKKALEDVKKLILDEKNNRDAKLRLASVRSLAKQYLDFLQTGEGATPKNQTIDNLKKYIRRQGFFDLRHEVDSQRFKPVFHIDQQSSGQIVAYCPQPEVSLYHTVYVVNANEFIEFADPKKGVPKAEDLKGIGGEKFDDLTEKLQRQELLLLRRLYIDFAAPYYLDSDAAGNDYAGVKKYVMKSPLDNLEVLDKEQGLKQTALFEQWKSIEKKIETDKITTVLKETPGKRTQIAFQEYLRDYVPPSLLPLLDKKEIHLNMEANIREKQAIFAVQLLANPKKGRLAIDIVGEPRHRKDAELEKSFPDLIKKKD